MTDRPVHDEPAPEPPPGAPHDHHDRRMLEPQAHRVRDGGSRSSDDALADDDAGATASPRPAPVARAERLDERRPLVERIGMAAIAIVLGLLFGGVGLAAFVNGEPFLGVMGAIGCLMTLWVGGLTLFRG